VPGDGRRVAALGVMGPGYGFGRGDLVRTMAGCLDIERSDLTVRAFEIRRLPV
jgi:hypothetical protein